MTSARSHAARLGLVAAALAGALLLALSGSPLHRSLHEGLDLRGGIEVVLQAEPPHGQKVTQAELSTAIAVMRHRTNGLGVSESVIRQDGPDRIDIQLPAVHDPRRAAAIVGRTAQLELYDLTPSLLAPSIGAAGTPVPETSLYDLLAPDQTGRTGKPSAAYLFRTTTRKVVGEAAEGPATRATLAEALRRRHGGSLPAGTAVLTVPHAATVVTCSASVATLCPDGVTGVQPAAGTTYYYLFKHGTYPGDGSGRYPELTGRDLELAGTQADVDPASGGPVVDLQFTSAGRRLFYAVTKAEAARGAELGVDQSFAIVLDGQLYSFPQILYRQNPNGIDPVGGAEITGLASLGEAKNLAVVLQGGALPIAFERIDETQVSATLGRDSLRQARDAAIGGLIAVAVTLLLLYRLLGLVAVLGLGLYAAFMYAAILLLDVTLTLPGFAGLILTIGVAADSNVVVFERIREEARAGRSVRAAVATGYRKGFRTIVDANVVTCITALVLFGFATDEVKGFALMLLIGTVVSLVTAVAATRALLGLLAGLSWFDRPRLLGLAGSGGDRLRLDFMRRRAVWLACSAAVILIGTGSLATRGLSLGIDFEGGVQIGFRTPQPDSLRTIHALVPADAVVQGRGPLTGSGRYESFQVQFRRLDAADETKLVGTLSRRLHDSGLQIENVSASFGHSILIGALWAIAASLVLIVVYIAIRFGLGFAGPVIVALLHDVAITVGVYSLSGREVTTATVAAVLTVLGYSIYDTIIVFDRIRENAPLLRRASFAEAANRSLGETIRRSLATTFMTLLPVASLFLFAGGALGDFAFALLVGIASGAYSSLFVAAPLLALWKERRSPGAAHPREAAPAAAVATPAVPVPAAERRARRAARRHGRVR